MTDAERFDYLLAEKVEEDMDIAAFGYVRMQSIFRRNQPITRQAIDEAIRFRANINKHRAATLASLRCEQRDTTKGD